MGKLSPFDGHEVRATGVVVRNAGDGLSKEMKIDPRELHHGEEVTIAIRCVVDKVRFDPITDTEDLIRIHVLKAGAATIIPDSLVKKHLEESALKIEKAKGIERLPFDGTKKAAAAKKAAAKKAPAKKAAPKGGANLTSV